MTSAVEILTQDHRKVEQLYQQYSSQGDGSLAQTICTELAIHAGIEQQVVYPVLAEIDAELHQRSLEEHEEMAAGIRDVDASGYNDATSGDRMRMLMDSVTHHVQEEESEVFPRLEEACDEQRLSDLGSELEQAKVALEDRRSEGPTALLESA